MIDEDVRECVHRALDIERPDPALRARVMAALPTREAETGRTWALVGVAAVLLAVAAVAGLLLSRHTASSPQGAVPPVAGSPAGRLSVVAPLDFRCTLPVVSNTTVGRIELPEGTVTIDHPPGTAGAPLLTGPTYRSGRWLPVPPAWVSPDGRSYGYATVTTGVPGQQPSATVFVHDIAGDRDRALWTGSGQADVAGWGPGGLYFIRRSGAGSEFWVVDPASPGGARRVGPNPAPRAGDRPLFTGNVFLGGGGAWTISGSQPVGYTDLVMRMDLRDGSLSTWYRAGAGDVVSLLGLDARGNPVVAVIRLPAPTGGSSATPQPAAPRLLLLTGPASSVTLSAGGEPFQAVGDSHGIWISAPGSLSAGAQPFQAVGDSHGIWISAPGSLWLYRGERLFKVADIPASLFPPPTAFPTPSPSGGSTRYAATIAIVGSCE